MPQDDKNPQPIAEVSEESVERTEMNDGCSDEALSGDVIGNAVESHTGATGSADAATAGAVGGFDESLTLIDAVFGVDAVQAGTVGGFNEPLKGAISDAVAGEMEMFASGPIIKDEQVILDLQDALLREIDSQRDKLKEQDIDIITTIDVMEDLIRTDPKNQNNQELVDRIQECRGLQREIETAIREQNSKEADIRSQMRQIQEERLRGNLERPNVHEVAVKSSDVKIQAADRPSCVREGDYGSDQEEDTSVKRDVDKKDYDNQMMEAARIRIEETEGADGLAIAEEAESENANEAREEGRITYPPITAGRTWVEAIHRLYFNADLSSSGSSPEPEPVHVVEGAEIPQQLQQVDIS